METPIDRLRKIVALLGPGIAVEINREFFALCFGGELGLESAGIEAHRFAKANGCSIELGSQRARLWRAYPKRTGEQVTTY